MYSNMYTILIRVHIGFCGEIQFHNVNERTFHAIVYSILIMHVGIFYLLVSTAKSSVHKPEFYLLVLLTTIMSRPYYQDTLT